MTEDYWVYAVDEAHALAHNMPVRSGFLLSATRVPDGPMLNFINYFSTREEVATILTKAVPSNLADRVRFEDTNTTVSISFNWRPAGGNVIGTMDEYLLRGLTVKEKDAIRQEYLEQIREERMNARPDESRRFAAAQAYRALLRLFTGQPPNKDSF
jgi:hypothetical protein